MTRDTLPKPGQEADARSPPVASSDGPLASKVATRMERPPPLPRPSKEDIELLPSYEQLAPDRIHLIRGDKQADFVLQCLADAGFVGFDTETKPIFTPGAKPNGPHIIQLATLDRAFVFQVGSTPPQDFLREALESNHLVKVGFGLKSDRAPMFRKFGIHLGASIELSQIVRKLGFRQAVGVKAAVAIVLGQRLQKSKHATKSNWALPKLKSSQLQYAADDAHAALAVFHALGCPIPEPKAERASRPPESPTEAS